MKTFIEKLMAFEAKGGWRELIIPIVVSSLTSVIVTIVLEIVYRAFW